MKPTILAVDLSFACYRASAAHPMLTSGKTFTGGLYGFLSTFGKKVRETQATQVVFCQDRKPYLRSEEYPEYKRIRAANKNEDLLKLHKESMELILDLLHHLDIPVWGIKGFESDDLIAHLVRKYRHRYTTIYADSNDTDLFQLLDVPNFHMFTTMEELGKDRKKLADLQITPSQHIIMTALTGTHNDIAGIDGVGPKTAVKAIKDPAVMRKYRMSHGDLIERNIGLITLPHVQMPWEAGPPPWPRTFQPRRLYRFLAQYEIETTAAMEYAFQQAHGS